MNTKITLSWANIQFPIPRYLFFSMNMTLVIAAHHLMSVWNTGDTFSIDFATVFMFLFHTKVLPIIFPRKCLLFWNDFYTTNFVLSFSRDVVAILSYKSLTYIPQRTQLTWTYLYVMSVKLQNNDSNTHTYTLFAVFNKGIYNMK